MPVAVAVRLHFFRPSVSWFLADAVPLLFAQSLGGASGATALSAIRFFATSSSAAVRVKVTRRCSALRGDETIFYHWRSVK